MQRHRLLFLRGLICVWHIGLLVFFLLGTAEASTLQIRSLAPAWQALGERLWRDGVQSKEAFALLQTLPPSPTQAPMGRKMAALYKKHFFPTPKPKPTQYYKGVVTEANAKTCRSYLAEHRAAFEQASLRYHVPPSIACALLFVETRLGKVLGDVPENALYTLASMAVSRTPEDISGWLPKMKGAQKHLNWIAKTMVPRAEWAYKEVRALLIYMVANGLGPNDVPGSIYGAVGLCQFMPSNIAVYAKDGNGDNRIDLFTIEDATMSLAHYLAKHGWQAGLTKAQQHRLLMRYNHSVVYANTILALAALIETPPSPKRTTAPVKR